MCHFITATLSADGDVSTVRGIARAHLLKWEPFEKPSIKKFLLEGETYYSTTRGMCDCGTAIGSAATDALLDEEIDYTRDIKKLRKKGWTQTKIDRWLNDQRRDRQRKQAEAQARRSAPSVEINHWIEFISTVLNQGHASHIGVLLHWYSGGIATERIPIGERQWVGLRKLDADYLLDADEDIIHTFTI